ncbi:L-lactate permease [Tribonema minus]|uniref:L-lactate permease n=1 Tax=Tribonema minus TaxID=303371 RepID=A0A835ZDZ7_9STRA|nr:L-lactate permease [Tribonema minus]
MEGLTGGRRVPQLMLLGWSFMWLLEGCSGFGTPIVVLVPVLVRLGFPAGEAVTFMLLSNACATAFGAVGTRIWYGLGTAVADGGAADADADLRRTGFLTAIGLTAASAVLMPAAVALATSRGELRRNAGFVALAVAGTCLPAVACAYASYEFPAVAGGLAGCAATAALVRFEVGLERRAVSEGTEADPDEEAGGGAKAAAAASPSSAALPPPSRAEALRSCLPVAGAVALLLLTRGPGVGLKALLTSTTPRVSASLGTYGDVSLSAALVFGLDDVLRQPDVDFRLQTLYLPSAWLALAGAATLATSSAVGLRGFPGAAGAACRACAGRLGHAARALVGALVFAELMVAGGDDSPASVAGARLAGALGKGLGSFFAGSSTVSNLTFGPIQAAAAGDAGFDVPAMLALQTCGASVGAAVCIFHIVAAGAVVSGPVDAGGIVRRLLPWVAAADAACLGAVAAAQAIVR